MSKKKKLIVVSSVLAACMLCSLSVLALSSQEETANADENSAAILSEADTAQSDVLEKVVSEEIGGEQMTEVQKISALSTATTCEKIEEVLGEPISTCGSYDLSNECLTPEVTKTYQTDNGKEVKVSYMYNAETDTEWVSLIEFSDGCFTEPGICDKISEYKNYPLKTNLTTEQFKQFVRYETTAEEVRSIVGRPYAFYGSGVLYDVYYTVDGDTVRIYYTSNYIVKEDGTVERGHTAVVNVIQLFTNNGDDFKDISIKGEIYEALKGTESYAAILE